VYDQNFRKGARKMLRVRRQAKRKREKETGWTPRGRATTGDGKIGVSEQ
jgi:hypothetical protein